MVIRKLFNKLSSFILCLRASYFFRRNCFNKGYRVTLGSRATILNPSNVRFYGRAIFGTDMRLECIQFYANNYFNPSIEFGINFSCGNYVHIGVNNNVSIGDNVLMGSSILISDHSHGIYNGENQSHSSPKKPPSDRILSKGNIIIGNNVWIGDSVKIIGDVTVGDGCVIGAGSIVTKDIPANSIVVGAPFKIIKQWCHQKNAWLKYPRNEVV